jgi:hypothetical protein
LCNIGFFAQLPPQQSYELRMNESSNLLPIESPDKKCDEVQYVIELLTSEACKYKALNATFMSK